MYAGSGCIMQVYILSPVVGTSGSESCASCRCSSSSSSSPSFSSSRLFSFGPSPLTVALTMLPLSLDMPDTAFRWTARHPDLPRGPINLRVVMHKPGMPNNEHVSTQGGDVEPGSLCVIAKPHNEVHILFNGPIFIQRTINIAEWY